MIMNKPCKSNYPYSIPIIQSWAIIQTQATIHAQTITSIQT